MPVALARNSLWSLLLLAATCGVVGTGWGGSAALAEPPSEPLLHRAAVRLEPATTDDGRAGEWASFAPATLAWLAAAPLGRSLRLLDWPIGPGERAAVTLRVFDPYAPGAEIWVVDGVAPRAESRSPLRFLLGAIDGDLGRLLIVVDPERPAALRATRFDLGQVFELQPASALGDGTWLLAAAGPFGGSPAVERSWSCGEGDAETSWPPALWQAGLPPEPPAQVPGFFPTAPPEPQVPEVFSTLHTAAIAVDTDNELMNRKFANSSTSATNYLAELFAAMNLFYERDLNLRLLQGTTYLRPSTTVDPYVQPCGAGVTDCQTGTAADTDRLSEFSNYWAAGCGGAGQPSCSGVVRALAMMLSGKQSSANSSSGIAWINGLCSSSLGYSFTQVFKFAGSNGSSDAFVVGHEEGHNFGSRHTHNPAGYNPPIDTCCTQTSYGNLNCGANYCTSGGVCCGDGAQACNACPAPTTINGVPNVRGTLMSYCHLLDGCSAARVFHPRTVDLISAILESQVGTCVFPADTFGGGFADGFESGTLPGAWDAKFP